MLQEYLKLNKNILIAFTASIIISAIIAQVLSDQDDYLNTTYTTIADYVIYFSVFSFLFYIDNRKKYRLESGKTDTKKSMDTHEMYIYFKCQISTFSFGVFFLPFTNYLIFANLDFFGIQVESQTEKQNILVLSFRIKYCCIFGNYRGS